MSAGTIISVIGTAVSLLSFAQSNFPEKENDGGSSMAFAVGLDIDGLSNAGGDLPDVRLFGEGGTFLGATYDPGYIQNGAAGRKVKIGQSGHEYQQPSYALFTANNDAICVAYVSQTWPDGSKWAWSGDWGRVCGGGTYYHSNIIINPDEPHKPDCLWIDANGDQPVTAFQVHFPDFTKNSDGSYNNDIGYYCNTPAYKYSFGSDPNGISYYVPPRDYNNGGINGKRSVLTERQEPNQPVDPVPDFGRVYSNDTRLVVSSDPQHTATSLCDADRSYGPDFVSMAEGLYCDMSVKTLYPLCVADADTNGVCFDLETSSLKSSGARMNSKVFSKILQWE